MDNNLDKPKTREERREERHQRREEWRNWRHEMHHEYWESRIFGALTLIIVGIVFLLNTTGILGWGIWINIFKFWPLFIVSAGISIIFRGSRLLKFIGSVITFVLFLIILFLAILNPFQSSTRIFFPFASSSNSTIQHANVTIKENEYSDVQNKSLNVDLSMGQVAIVDSESKDYLNLVTDFYVDSQKVVVTKNLEDSNLSVSLTNNNQNNFFTGTQGPNYAIDLGQNSIPTNLALNFGAGDSVVNLSSQLINNFSVEVGAGNSTLQVSRISLPTGSFNVKTGLGNLKLSLPSNVGLKINYKVGLGNISLNDKKLSSGTGNSTFISDNYDTASKNVVINVEVGLGNIDIVTE
ncbi:MAG: LiaF domain-containing protein [Candidatus Dojkabacteria bacterium]